MVTEPLAEPDGLGVGLAVAPARVAVRLVAGTVAGDVVFGVAIVDVVKCQNKNKVAVLKVFFTQLS